MNHELTNLLELYKLGVINQAEMRIALGFGDRMSGVLVNHWWRLGYIK